MWHYDTAAPMNYGLLKANARKNRAHMTLAEEVLYDTERVIEDIIYEIEN